MNTAQAAVLEAFHAPLKIQRFPTNHPVEPGGAWVRTEMAGICGTDVHLWKGELPITLPIILGHETVGRIEAMGAGLERDWRGTELHLGDRVTWNSASSCGQCFYCRKQQPTRCPARRAYGIGYRCDESPHFLGGYAERHYLKPGVTLFRIPDSVPTEAVIGAGCALITAIHGVERIAMEPNLGLDAARAVRMPVLPELWQESVVIQGAGPVGIAALAVAKNAGSKLAIVIGGPPARLELAKRFGADHCIDVTQQTTPAARAALVRDLTGGYGADVVIECVGAPAAVAEGLELCRDGGKYLVLGQYCNAGPVSLVPHHITRKQLQVFGSWSSEPRHLAAAIDFLSAHRDRFPFDAMVTHRFSLAQVNEALATTAQWQSAKSVIVPHLAAPAA